MPRTTKTFRRYLAPRLREALADTPAVLIHGPRQSGKTALKAEFNEEARATLNSDISRAFD